LIVDLTKAKTRLQFFFRRNALIWLETAKKSFGKIWRTFKTSLKSLANFCPQGTEIWRRRAPRAISGRTPVLESIDAQAALAAFADDTGRA
jgi:hypothetical protein